jgi:pyridoxamine 5'-phosphate oxidase
MNLEQIRRQYCYRGLSREELADNPLEQFETWMQQACDAEVLDATAMTLATVSAGGRPSQRVVLLKHSDERGFVFYTNLESRKAHDIAANPNVSLHFAWLALSRQVIINGVAEKLSPAEVLRYFASRPYFSQLAAWASHQSHPVSSRALLEEKFEQMKRKYREGKVPLPSFWGGYRVKPEAYEFWQGREHRLHDRFTYTRQADGGWAIERLEP